MALSDHRAIDCHAHVGSFRGYDLRVSTLLSNLKRHRVALALVSNIDGAALPDRTRNLGEGEANRRTAEVVLRHPAMLRGLLWARPPDGAAERLEPFLRETLKEEDGTAASGVAPGKRSGGNAPGWTRRIFVGLKLHPEMNGFPADAPEVDPYLELCRRAGLPVVVHCDGAVEEASAERIHRLARRHPEVSVVLYHMGFGGPHEPAIRAAEEAARTGDARLYLETAQADPDAVVSAVERVGAGRVLFGTDATYYGSAHYERYEPLVGRLEASLEPEPLARIFRSNTLALFGLEPGGGKDTSA